MVIEVLARKIKVKSVIQILCSRGSSSRASEASTVNPQNGLNDVQANATADCLNKGARLLSLLLLLTGR